MNLNLPLPQSVRAFARSARWPRHRPEVPWVLRLPAQGVGGMVVRAVVRQRVPVHRRPLHPARAAEQVLGLGAVQRRRHSVAVAAQEGRAAPLLAGVAQPLPLLGGAALQTLKGPKLLKTQPSTSSPDDR